MPDNAIHDAFLTHQRDSALFLETPDGSATTYGDFRHAVGAQAGALRALGVAPGDRVLCQIAKSPDALSLYLATVMAGAVFVPLNPAYTATELDYFLDDAAPALLILVSSQKSEACGSSRPAG